MKRVFDFKAPDGQIVVRLLAESPEKAKEQVDAFLQRTGRKYGQMSGPVEVTPTPEGVVAHL